MILILFDIVGLFTFAEIVAYDECRERMEHYERCRDIVLLRHRTRMANRGGCVKEFHCRRVDREFERYAGIV